jgi:hypothetical protein
MQGAIPGQRKRRRTTPGLRGGRFLRPQQPTAPDQPPPRDGRRSAAALVRPPGHAAPGGGLSAAAPGAGPLQLQQPTVDRPLQPPGRPLHCSGCSAASGLDQPAPGQGGGPRLRLGRRWVGVAQPEAAEAQRGAQPLGGQSTEHPPTHGQLQ